MRTYSTILGLGVALWVAACSGGTQHSPATGSAGNGGQSSGGSAPQAGSATLGPATAIADFPHVYAEAVCQLLTRCYTAATALVPPNCTAYFERLFREQTFPAIATGVAEDRVEYHAAAVPQCLEGIKTASCDFTLAADCSRVFVGTKKTGEACTLDLECLDQECVVDAACPGVCAPPAALGEDCTNHRCAPELACRADDAGARKCSKTAKLGEACSASLPCRSYSFCSGLDPSDADDTGICVERGSLRTAKLGDACEPVGEPLCVDDLVCTTRVENGITVGSCQPRVASASACTFSTPDACPDYEYCHITSDVGVKPATGTCTPKPALGEECRYGTLNIAPCGDGQFCDLDSKLCAESKHLEESCSLDRECYSTRCSAAGKCVALTDCEKAGDP